MVVWLKCFGAWLWKEWRDHRAVTIGILVAIPALTALAFSAFGEHLATVWLRTSRAVFLGIALGLVNFAVAASLFAGETRRGTLRALRRLPRALGAAFCAKVTFLALLVVFVTAWQGAALAIAEAGNGGIAVDLGLRKGADGGPLRAMALWNGILDFPTSELWINGLGFGAVCLWTLLVSTWMGRSGVAGIGAVVLLAALGTPFFLFFLAHPYFFPGPTVLAGWATAVAAVVALVAAAVSFLWGGRFDGRPLRPFLAGTCVLLVALGGGYAYAHVALEDWLDIDPHDADFNIYEAHVGAGERHLFLTVHRGDAWVGDSNLSAREHAQWTGKRGTPFQAWVMDLDTGALRKFRGGKGRYFMAVPEISLMGPVRSYEPPPALVCYELGADKKASSVTWWDAATAEPKRTLPARVRDPVSLDLVRSTLAACAWQRDGKGRRVWLRDDVIEREGVDLYVPTGLVPRALRGRILWPVPGGWYGWRKTLGSGKPPKIFVDADTEEERILTPDYPVSSYGHGVLSGAHTLGIVTTRNEDGARVAQPMVIPLSGGEAREPVNPPRCRSSVIGRDLVLALRGPDSGRTLHAWNPLTGQDTPIAWAGPQPQGIDTATVYGHAGDGRMLVHLRSVSPQRRAWAVLSPDASTAKLVRDWYGPGTCGPIALLGDDTLVVVEPPRRVVRYGLGRPAEVLFPR